MYKIFVPKQGYSTKHSLIETQRGIKIIKDSFERELAKELDLERISAPLFLFAESGLNDDLNGVERPVSFDVKDIEPIAQVVQSLAKWKRFALKQYNFTVGRGLYTDMNAIRRDEDFDNLHSIYVDQWDWERVINKSDRNMNVLQDIVRKIYRAIKVTGDRIASQMDHLTKFLPNDIFFITSEELFQKYPTMTSKERENAICKEYGAVFIMQIGAQLSNGERHDGRSPDYDDWSLNGDILVWFPLLECALELSSMGIRVDEETLRTQCQKAHAEDRLTRPYHKMLLEGRLPYTIGGGIGQSRLCMLFLEKLHIGEVQASVWPAEMVEECKKAGIRLL